MKGHHSSIHPSIHHLLAQVDGEIWKTGHHLLPHHGWQSEIVAAWRFARILPPQRLFLFEEYTHYLVVVGDISACLYVRFFRICLEGGVFFFCGPTASVLVAWLWPRITGPGDLLSWIVDTTETFLALFKRPEKKAVCFCQSFSWDQKSLKIHC